MPDLYRNGVIYYTNGGNVIGMEMNRSAEKEAYLAGLRKEREELLQRKPIETDPEVLKRINEKIEVLDGILNPIDPDFMLLPEYRADGYFNSAEFKKIEADVDAMIQKMENLDLRNIEEVKKKLLKEIYHIDWKPTYERYLSGTLVMRD